MVLERASRPGPGDKQHLRTTCVSGGSFVPDKSCTFPQQAEFLFKTFSVENEVESSALQNSALQRGGNSWPYWLPAGALCVQHLWPLPSPQSTNSLLFLCTRLACLLLKGWVILVRLAKFLAKIHPLKGRDPVLVGAVMMWFLQHSAQPGVSKAEVVPVPYCSLTSISNTTKKLHYPAVKTHGKAGSRLSLVTLVISFLKVCAWETQVWNSIMTRHANLSPSCAWCRNSTGVKKWGCWHSFIQHGGLCLVASGMWAGLMLAGHEQEWRNLSAARDSQGCRYLWDLDRAVRDPSQALTLKEILCC